jgi:hypothetical protein
MNYIIFVHLEELQILNAGDPGDGWGEIGFEIRINNVIVAHRWGYEIAPIKDGQTIPLEISHAVSGDDPKTLKAVIDWRVWDVDDISDDMASERVVFTFQKPPTRPKGDDVEYLEVPFGRVVRRKTTYVNGPVIPIDRTELDVALVMSVTSQQPFVVGEPAPVLTRKTTSKLIGAIFYDYPLNNRNVFLERFDRTSQHFGVGSYNLPATEIEFQRQRVDQIVLKHLRKTPGDIAEIPLTRQDSTRLAWKELVLKPLQPNSAEAIRVGTGYYVEAYSERDFQGDMIILEENMDKLPSGWNKNIESFIVQKITPVTH